MSERCEYALLRVVPDPERGEHLNAGVVLHCPAGGFLGARVGLDESRLLALAPAFETAPVRSRLEALAGIAAGRPDTGPEASLPPGERFARLVAAVDGVIGPGPVLATSCDDPRAELDRLFRRLVESPLAAMRKDYLAEELGEAQLAGTWLEQFRRWFAEAGGVVEEPNAMVLATASAGGEPSARVVLLKGVDERGFTLFTNYASRKGRDAAANPRAAIVFPWTAMERQVAVGGAIERVPAAESDAYFASRPRGAQLSAAASPQSEVVASRAELERLRAAVEREHPEAALVPRPGEWGGLRVVPDTVEFWQGRPDRLHDRLRFRLGDDGDWRVERLAP